VVNSKEGNLGDLLWRKFSFKSCPNFFHNQTINQLYQSYKPSAIGLKLRRLYINNLRMGKSKKSKKSKKVHKKKSDKKEERKDLKFNPLLQALAFRLMSGIKKK
jgi:hypothetical protein